MRVHKISTLTNYKKWEQWFHKNGYQPWQYQYRWDAPEGYHVWFAKAGQEDVEIVTYSRAVHEAIMKFKKPPE